MSRWGETQGVTRTPDATDRSVPPGAVDPKVRIPIRLMTPAEQRRGSEEWTIIGGGGIVEVGSGCLSSDTRSSMEEYWRRRPVIVGADIARFWENLFQGRNVTMPRVDAVPIPPGWKCGPWRKDTAPVSMPAGGIVQRHETWWRICTPPGKPAGGPPVRPGGALLRPPRPQTPRPALPVPVKPKTIPTKITPGAPMKRRPSTCGPWMRTPIPPGTPMGDPTIETRTLRGGRSAGIVEWRRCKPGAGAPKKPTAAELDGEIVMAWLAQHEALAAELAAQPPDVRRAILVENPEILYVWILLGWIEVDDGVRQAFEVLSSELAEIGLSLFDFEAAARADLPPAVAKELKATPIGLATLLEPAPSSTQVAAGVWDEASGVFLPSDPSTMQRASYGYTPQAPRMPLGADGQALELAQQQVPAELRISGCGCEGGPGKPPSPTRPRIGGPLTVRDTDRGMELEHAPCATRVGSVEDPRCCPECAIENLGPTARAWCAGLVDPRVRIGDAWADFGRGFAAADRWLSDNVWENVKGVVPYGNVIDAAHQTRMRALEAAAPDFYPARASSSRTPARGAAKPKGPATRSSSTTEAATDRAITAATRLAAGVRDGDARTIATVKRIKDRAEAGDPEARRNWRVYVLVSTDLHGTA